MLGNREAVLESSLRTEVARLTAKDVSRVSEYAGRNDAGFRRLLREALRGIPTFPRESDIFLSR